MAAPTPPAKLACSGNSRMPANVKMTSSITPAALIITLGKMTMTVAIARVMRLCYGVANIR